MQLTRNLFILLIFSIFTISCSEKDILEESENPEKVETQFSSQSVSDLCEIMEVDSDVTAIFNITGDYSIKISDEIHSPTELNEWTVFGNYLNGVPPTQIVPESDINAYLSDDVDLFLEYNLAIMDQLSLVLNKYSGMTSETEIVEALKCALSNLVSSPTSIDGNNSYPVKTSCLIACKNVLDQCLIDAKSDGATTAVSHMIVGIGWGIVTINPAPIFGGMASGIVHGVLGAVNDSRQCKEAYEFCVTGCPH